LLDLVVHQIPTVAFRLASPLPLPSENGSGTRLPHSYNIPPHVRCALEEALGIGGRPKLSRVLRAISGLGYPLSDDLIRGWSES
jgi:hypothetical protein